MSVKDQAVLTNYCQKNFMLFTKWASQAVALENVAINEQFDDP